LLLGAKTLVFARLLILFVALFCACLFLGLAATTPMKMDSYALPASCGDGRFRLPSGFFSLQNNGFSGSPATLSAHFS
jgi:hypothetical protein